MKQLILESIFSFNDKEKSIFYQWGRIQIICQDFKVKNNKFYLFNKSNHIIVIHPNVSSFDNDCFWNYSNLSSIILPNSITSLSNSYFSGCSKLTSIILPNSITSLG
jgi:hypothetical protein